MAGRRLTQGVEVDQLDRLIKDLGVRVRIYKSTLCPNLTSLESMDHDINCSLCNNNMIDFCPVETIAMFQQQHLAEAFKIQGTFDINEILVTFRSGITLQTYARIELLDFKEDFYELIQKQTGDTDLLKYPACEVLGLFTIEGSPKKVVEYHEGIDFNLDLNGSVKWIGTRKPANKAVYTIYYKYHPVYRAMKAVHRDRFSQYNTRPDHIQAPKTSPGDGNTYVKMPETWVLVRDYLMERRNENTGDKLTNNTYFDPNE